MLGNSLVIYDVSYLINVGTKSPYKADQIMGMACGGIIFLFEKVFAHLGEGRSIALAFDSKCDKKEAFPEYKATRARDFEIATQCQMALDFAKKMGLPVFKQDGYEADEIIFNLVNANKTVYTAVDIYARDADLACNVTDEKIRIIGCTPDAPMITKDNYFTELFSDRHVPYNTVLASILTQGKKSNNISPIQLECKAKPIEVFRDYCSYCEKQGVAEEHRSDRKIAAAWLMQKMGKLSAADMKTIKDRINMIWPRQMEGNFNIPFNCKQGLDQAAMVQFMRIFGLRVSAMNMGLSSEVNSMLDMGREERQLMLRYRTMAETGAMLGHEDIPVQTNALEDTSWDPTRAFEDIDAI